VQTNPYTKEALKRIMKRFLNDPNRGISMARFAELAGISLYTLRDVFLYKTVPLSVYVQHRVGKAYEHVRKGEVRVMAKGNKRYVEYRKEPQLKLRRNTQLVLTADGFQIKTGVQLKGDYTQPTLEEQIRSRYGRRS